jgi:hypothetical protein
VCIEQEERQEGEKNLFSRNPSDLSLTKSQKHKECMGNQNPLRINLRRDSTFHKCRRDPIDALEGGAKVEAFGYLENHLSQRKSEAQEGEKQWTLDHRFRGPTVIRSNQGVRALACFAHAREGTCQSSEVPKKFGTVQLSEVNIKRRIVRSRSESSDLNNR